MDERSGNQRFPSPSDAKRVVHRGDVVERFWAKVDKDGPNGCWVWTAHKSRLGYGMYTSRVWQTRFAHRISWFLTHGWWAPKGMHTDHLCRNTSCVNPAHLEVVTPRENCVARGRGPAHDLALATHCKNGHPFDEQNTQLKYGPYGRRDCKICKDERVARFLERHGGAAAYARELRRRKREARRAG